MLGARTAIAALILLPQIAWAADYLADPATYRDAVHRLQAGDRLLLAPGDYRQGLPLSGLSGQAQRPITIEAAHAHQPPRFIARRGHNTVSLVDVRHLVLRNLELDGGNLPVDAVKAEKHSRRADFITLERLHIHSHAASQQNVAISTKSPAFGWVIRDNDIERVGTGLYLGDSDGSAPFVGGLIEGNRISKTLGYNLQIKHQTVRPADLTSRHDTVIRYNVFSKQGSAPGPMARPNLLLGHFPLQGAGADDRYLVYGNLFLHNPSEALVQAEGRAAFYDNVLVNGDGDAIHIQPHNDVPRDIDIFSNTILASGNGIRIRGGGAGRYRQRVAANIVAAGQPIVGGDVAGNVVLRFRPAWLDVSPTDLGTRLLAVGQDGGRLAVKLDRSFDSYPDWQRSQLPGARPSASWSRTREGDRP